MAGMKMLLLGLAAMLLQADALIERLTVRDDTRLMFAVDTFGFDEGGKIDLKIKKLKIIDEDDKPVTTGATLGIVVSNVDTEFVLRMEEQVGICLIEQEGLQPLDDATWKIDPSKTETDIQFTIPAGKAEKYSVFYYNCKQGSKVSFEMDIQLYNEYADGERDYLSVGQSKLPSVWFSFGTLFLIAFFFWVVTLKSQWEHKHAIHYLMTLLLVLKFLTMYVDGFKYAHLKSTGLQSAWDWIWFFMYGTKTATLFICIVLIGSGWSFVKPFLSDRDKKIVMVILPLQVLNNIALVVTQEENQGSQSWATWRDVLHLFDIICCCAILFPIVWSIKHLREAAATDGKAAVNAEKLTLFRQFYMMVVCYIYFTRIIVFLLSSTLPFRLTWMSEAATQGATLLFYVITGYKFRPMPANPYLRISQEDEDDARELEMNAMETDM